MVDTLKVILEEVGRVAREVGVEGLSPPPPSPLFFPLFPLLSFFVQQINHNIRLLIRAD
jgi:hypothetical protein